MKSVLGVVNLVQEQRFQLTTDGGGAMHFVLAHRAPLEGRDLQTLQEAGSRVAVHYEDAGTLIGHIAHDVVLERTS